MRKLTDPERSIGAQINELSRLFSRNFNNRVRHHGLTQTQWQALAVLTRREGIRQAALAEHLNVQPISLARLIDRMENAGWVERRPDPTDRRAVQLFLTPKAEPILDEMAAAAIATRDAALAHFDAMEREQLFELLKRMKTNLGECVAETPAGTVAPHEQSRNERQN